MGRKGDLLELIDGAPIGVSTLTGSVWIWMHRERSHRALMQRAQPQDGSVSVAATERLKRSQREPASKVHSAQSLLGPERILHGRHTPKQVLQTPFGLPITRHPSEGFKAVDGSVSHEVAH